MNKDVQNKIRSCKALQGKSVADIIQSKRFLENLSKYMKAQVEDRNTAIEIAAGKKGGRPFKLKAHVIDRLQGLMYLPEEFAEHFSQVLAKSSPLPAAEREYIRQLGLQAYNLTIAQIAAEEYPELKDILFPKSKTN